MHRRYTIHRDGDLLVEDLDDQGNAIDPEPVSAEDRLPVEVIIRSTDDSQDGKALLLELLELAYGMESDGPPEPPDPSKFKSNRP